jgi:hypothetical protein
VITEEFRMIPEYQRHWYVESRERCGLCRNPRLRMPGFPCAPCQHCCPWVSPTAPPLDHEEHEEIRRSIREECATTWEESYYGERL